MREELLSNQRLMEYYVGLREKIPKHSRELFKRKLDWELLKKHDVIENKMRNWARQKSIELLTEANNTFVELVVNLLNKESGIDDFFDKLERLLDDQTKDFIKQLWRFLTFEELKLRFKSK